MTSVSGYYSALHNKVKSVFAVHKLDFPRIGVNVFATPSPYGRRLYHQQAGATRLRGVFPLPGQSGTTTTGMAGAKCKVRSRIGGRGMLCVRVGASRGLRWGI